jgi:predicted permease
LNPLNIDMRALAVTSAAGVLASLAAGVLPAWIGTRVDGSESSLRVSERSGTETRAARALTRTLLVGEIALACTLLVGATLLVRSFVNLVTTDRGLDASGVMMAWVSFPAAAWKDPAERAAIARTLEERIRELPVTQQVAWSYGIPPQGGMTSEGAWTGSGTGGRAVTMEVDSYYVGPDFFALYGIPLLRGRIFEPQEAKGSVIVGERLAEALWPGQDPIGRSFDFEGKRRLHVVGLAREIRLPSLESRLDSPEFYEPSREVGSTMMMSIRCRGACPDTGAIRHRLMTAHPAVRLNRVAPIESFYFEQLARPRAAAALGFAFAAIAVAAAAGGLFSVLTYAVGRRRKEFGVRTALGASPREIRGLVLRDGFTVTLSGTVFGVVAAWSLTSVLASLQYGVTVSDPVSWTIVVGLLGITGVLASWRPAAEAVRADPVRLLREE